MPKFEIQLLVTVLVESELDIPKSEAAEIANEAIAEGLNTVYHRHGFANDYDHISMTIEDVDNIPEPEEIDPEQQYYKDNGGNKCPYCHSEEIEGGSIEIDSNVATQEVWCHDCDEHWNDFYDFAGFHKH